MAPIQLHRFSRIEYDRLIAKGAFDAGQRVELLGGRLVVREPQGSPHATAIGLGLDALRAAFDSGWSVRVQLPIALDDESEPEPDLAVVPGGPRDYARAHPTRPVLIVEVSESTLDLDREHKGSLYARAGHRGLLDREPRRSGDRDLPRARAHPRRRVRLAILRGHPRARLRLRHAAGRAGGPHRRRRPAAVDGSTPPSIS